MLEGFSLAFLKISNMEKEAFKKYSEMVKNRFDVSDYAIKVMWCHLPYKRRLPFIELVRKENKDFRRNK
jgi:hypothetical protein